MPSLSLYTYYLETISLTRPGAHHFTSRLDDQQASGTFLFPLYPSTEVIGTQSCLVFYMDVRHLSSCPHALTASTLSSCIKHFSVALIEYPDKK